MPSRADPPLRAVVVDDEPLARDCIRLALERDGGVEIVGEFGCGRDAVAGIRELAPDLVFLDVKMPGMDGFGVLETVGAESMPAVVFVTAFDQHAIRAFRVHALDYVVKPFDDERLLEAVRHARERLAERRVGETGRRLAALLGELGGGAGEYLERLQVPVGDRIRFVPVDQVDWFEAAGNYVRLHVGSDSHLVRTSLGGLAGRLDPRRFARIHRSTIVNRARVRELEPWFGGDYILHLDDGRKLRVSRTHRAALLGAAP